MVLSKASKDETSRFVTQVASYPFRHSSRLISVYMMSRNDICVKVHFFVINGNDSYTNISRGVHSRTVFNRINTVHTVALLLFRCKH